MKFREYVGLLTDKEFNQLMYAIYYSGVMDGKDGRGDSPTNSFSSIYSEHSADYATSSLENYTEIPVNETYRKYTY